MQQANIDRNPNNDIMTPEEVAQYLHKSLSWVYQNWRILGARKLRGSLFFPSKEELYGRIFQKREGMEIQLHPERNQVYKSLVSDKKRGERSRSKNKGGDKQSKTGTGNTVFDRHNLL